MKNLARLALAALLSVSMVHPAVASDATRAARFEQVNGKEASPKAFTRVDLATALRSLGEVSRSFDYAGNGNAEFWMKITRDFVRSGRALGAGMQTLARSMNPGPLSAAISGVGANLGSLSAQGQGDAYFWMARAKETAQRISGAGQQLDTIAASLTSTANGAESVPAGAALMALAQVAYSLDYAGHGDAEYWMRTTRNFVRVGRGVGRGVSLVSGGLPSPLNAVLAATANQLTNLSEAGNGTADYWMARARGVAEQVRGHGQSLNDIAVNLP